MNLLLVDDLRDSYRIPPEDPRVNSILRLAEGRICLGVVNGPRGVGAFRTESDGGVVIETIAWEKSVAELPPIDLIVGLPRPAEARRIVVQASAMGVRRLTFVVLDRTPGGYVDSRSLSDTSMHRLVRDGLEQGFHTAWPQVNLVNGLKIAIDSVDPAFPVSVLDPYLGGDLLGEDAGGPDFPGTVILGSERGFSPDEQEFLKDSAVRLRHLGPSILRTETAVVSALTLAHRQTGFSLSSRRSVIAVD